MIELWVVAFLVFIAISTTLSYVYGFTRGEEFATNLLIDDMIDQGILEVVDEDE
jgi:hypothetical protein